MKRLISVFCLAVALALPLSLWQVQPAEAGYQVLTNWAEFG